MRCKFPLSVLLIGLIFPVQGQADQAASPAPVVVELFTSQNCTDCLRADELLASIAHNPDNGLIVLGCHVALRDHLKDQDTLALDACTQRQRDYAASLSQGRSYTPNMVINGRASFDASRPGAFESALRKARLKDDVALIDIMMTQAGFEISLPALPAGQRIGYELTVIAFMTNRSVEIREGIDKGKIIINAHAVSDIVRLSPWQGNQETRLIPNRDLNPEHLHGIAVIAQPVRGGIIRAAGEYRIYFN